jgi:hypothetical protein
MPWRLQHNWQPLHEDMSGLSANFVPRRTAKVELLTRA